jgi:hypothetical protein
VTEVMAGRVEQKLLSPAAGDEGVGPQVGLMRVAGLGEVSSRRHQHHGGRERQALVAGAQDQCGREVAARRGAADDDPVRRPLGQQRPAGGQAVVEGGREGMVGQHPVVDRPHPGAHPGRGADRHRGAELAATPDEPAAVHVEVDPLVVLAEAGRPDLVDAMAPSWAAIIARHAAGSSSGGYSARSAGGFASTAWASRLTVDGTAMSRAGSRMVPGRSLTAPRARARERRPGWRARRRGRPS